MTNTKKTWHLLCLLMAGFNPAWAFTVSFNAGSGTCESESLSESSHGSGIVLPTATCSDPGWSFAGWAEDEVAITSKQPNLIAAGTTFFPSADMQLFAVYKLQEGEMGTYKRATSIQDVATAQSIVIVNKTNQKTLTHNKRNCSEYTEDKGIITPDNDAIFDFDGNNENGFTFSYTYDNQKTYMGIIELPTKTISSIIQPSEKHNKWFVEQNSSGDDLFCMKNTDTENAALTYSIPSWVARCSDNYTTYSAYALKLYIPNFSISYATRITKESELGGVGYATFYDSQHALRLPDEVCGYVAYTDAEGFHFEQQYNAGDIIPKGVAVVLKGTGNIDLAYTTGGTTPAFNALRGADKNMTAEEMAAAETGQNYFYALSLDKDGNNVGFYWINEDGSAFDIPAGKAYLVLPQSANARSSFVLGEESDWISLPYNDETDGNTYYNVNGVREPNETKGLVIRNGKKLIIK